MIRYVLPLVVLAGCVIACQPTAEPAAGNSWMMTGFVKADSLNPILTPSSEQQFTDPLTGNTVRWEERNVLNPAAVIRDGEVYLFYRAQDSAGTSRIGLATSSDGLHFKKEATPVFYPANDSMKVFEWNYTKSDSAASCSPCFDGVEDPRVIMTEDGRYLMTYTAYDGRTARLSLAFSEDLRTWKKEGLVLRDSVLRDTWSKSGAIVVRREGENMVATRIQGKYWMYYGDTDLFMATSDDLIHWDPVLSAESGNRISVLHPRPGYFDSRLVEPGPFALLTENGILMLYNGSNARNYQSPGLPEFTYSAGQALFDREAPYKLLDRSDSYFLHPEKDYEKSGEVNLVCFIEGLVYLENRWFLYYGTADSRIAVAVLGETGE